MDNKMLLTILFIGLLSSSGCAQNKEENQVQEAGTDSSKSEIVDGLLESPFKVVKKPTLILPDSLKINGASGHVIVEVYLDSLGTIKKGIGILVLKNNHGDRIVEYIKGSKELAESESSQKIDTYFNWVNSRLEDLKVEKKEEVGNTKLVTRIMLRIESR